MPILLENGSAKANHGMSARRRAARLFCWLMLALAPLPFATVAAAQQPVPPGMPISMAGQGGATSPVLSLGDLLDVEVFNTPELSVLKARIDQDGGISLPVLGNVKVAGLTPAQANAYIEQRLRDAQIMSSPSVTILVIEYASRGVDVLGQVRLPGIYMFLGPHTLYDALAAAGGVLATQGSTITVTHHEDPGHPVVVNVGAPDFAALESSTVVQSGDVVEVGRAPSIYVVGDVLHSGQFPITNGKPITALEALALAEGPNKTARLTKAAIVRKTATGVQLIPIDLHQVEKATLADPVMLTDDVLVIPRNAVQAFIETALPGATAGVIAALAYNLHN